ncbi:16S rRNA (cytosine(967)-C(5))-methyltransferase [Geomicrobium sp. JCM 19038]|nr:16S rRNA (cytosine(967)-C(5))-methyltransferase [Geomicrobium sp. JCM 19038]
MHAHKKRLIEKEANRLQLSIVHATTEDAVNLAKTYQDVRFDRILVDAPCSGLGVLRSKPDIKWNTDEKEIRKLPALQLDILNAASKLLKDDGVLVYSTCTILPEENEHVVQEFLKNNEDFTHDESLQERIKIQSKNQGYTTILPHQYGSDGFFICAMKKGSARHGNEN